MAQRSDHSHEKFRIMALEATTQVILEQGHPCLTACKVASEIGYTAGALYLDFENLINLILHINAHTLDRLFTGYDRCSIAEFDRRRSVSLSSANSISTLFMLISTAGRSYLNIVLLRTSPYRSGTQKNRSGICSR
ncbi:MAG: hypothetical protein AB2806_20210 [Candidatus Thiodiazotropha sp.]